MPQDSEQFQQTPTPGPDLLHELARDYFKRTETYDRSVCTGPVTPDGVLPGNEREFALIQRFGDHVQKACEMQAAAAGFTAKELRQAFRNYDGSHEAAADMREWFPSK